MTALVTQRFHKLSDSLVELKGKVREAMATELAGAVGTAVRDILVVVILDRIINTPRSSTRPPLPRSGGWREDEYERDRWGEPKEPWSDPDECDRDRTHGKYERDERDEDEPTPAVPTAAVIAVGVNVGRWWLARKGTVPTAIGIGVLATALGLAGGPFARAALAVLAAATDLMTAESALARTNPS